MWQDWANAILGLAVIGVAFMGLEATALTWTLGILGALIAVVGFWGAVSLGGESESTRSHA